METKINPVINNFRQVAVHEIKPPMLTLVEVYIDCEIHSSEFNEDLFVVKTPKDNLYYGLENNGQSKDLMRDLRIYIYVRWGPPFIYAD